MATLFYLNYGYHRIYLPTALHTNSVLHDQRAGFGGMVFYKCTSQCLNIEADLKMIKIWSSGKIFKNKFCISQDDISVKTTIAPPVSWWF